MNTVSSVVRRTLEFAPGLYADVVRPTEIPHPLPAVVWLHGGGWRMQDRTARPDLERYFARAGYVMVSIDYRLAPGTVHPGQLTDVHRAVRFLREHADELRLDPARIALWGSSAGGHLAALAGLDSRGTGIASVVDGYGPADLPALIDLDAPRAPGEDTSPEASLLGGAIRDRLALARAASPVHHVSEHAPPMLILHGTADTLVPHTQSVALYEALEQAGADAALYLIDDFGHGFFNPGDVLELGPGVQLDQGRLERVGAAPAHARGSTPAAREFIAAHPHASFATVEAFLARTLKEALS